MLLSFSLVFSMWRQDQCICLLILGRLWLQGLRCLPQLHEHLLPALRWVGARDNINEGGGGGLNISGKSRHFYRLFKAREEFSFKKQGKVSYRDSNAIKICPILLSWNSHAICNCRSCVFPFPWISCKYKMYGLLIMWRNSSKVTSLLPLVLTQQNEGNQSWIRLSQMKTLKITQWFRPCGENTAHFLIMTMSSAFSVNRFISWSY